MLFAGWGSHSVVRYVLPHIDISGAAPRLSRPGALKMFLMNPEGICSDFSHTDTGAFELPRPPF